MITPVYKASALLRLLIFLSIAISFGAFLLFPQGPHRILATAIPWMYVLGLRIWKSRLLLPFCPSEVVAIESLPKQVRVHLQNGGVRTYTVDSWNLEDLRAQLEDLVVPRLVQSHLAKIESGQPIPLQAANSHIVGFLVLVSLVLFYMSPWLLIIPALLCYSIRADYNRYVRVHTLESDGCRLNDGSFVSWDDVSGLSQGCRTVLSTSQRHFILTEAHDAQAWLASRIVQKRSNPTVVFHGPGRLFREQVEDHARFVLGPI